MNVKLDAGAQMPVKAHETDAGYDLFAMQSVYINGNGGSAAVDTGVHIEIPAGWFGLVTSRSGLNFKYGVIVPQGTVDAGFCGSIKVKMYNHSCTPYQVHRGDRIAQIIFLRHESPELETVDTLSTTERGSGGFGSTGV